MTVKSILAATRARRHRRLLLLLLAIPLGCYGSEPASPTAAAPGDFREDAASIGPLISRVYAYTDRFVGQTPPSSDVLAKEAAAVRDHRSLLKYAERALLALSDHHAITGASFRDSWAVVPSFADLWIVRDGARYLIDSVRDDSPSDKAGVSAGDVLVTVNEMPIDEAVNAFWADLGLPVSAERASFAARVLTAGRRDRPRKLTIRAQDGVIKELVLPSLYSPTPLDAGPLTSHARKGELTIRLNDSLGSELTVVAFDEAMADADPNQTVVIDLRDTPSGGNTTVARAILGWFVDRPSYYQVHNLPAELRTTGVERQWVEQVLPRRDKYHPGPVRVLVGRWTGSMGEGLAIAFDALGASVAGTRMAGLLGAVYDYPLKHSGIVLKIPTERLSAIDGTRREDFVPPD